jgi:uncharacterized membrane protein
VALTGIFKLDAGTPSGLLSVDAFTGKPSIVSVFVKNTGSAVNRNIGFSSFKPENWKVEFKPEKVENLEPGAIKQVEMAITPGQQALIGDYSVSVQVEGEKANDNVEFRVTIRAASKWAWIGVGIIVLVVLGLSLMFRILGRR